MKNYGWTFEDDYQSQTLKYTPTHENLVEDEECFIFRSTKGSNGWSYQGSDCQETHSLMDSLYLAKGNLPLEFVKYAEQAFRESFQVTTFGFFNFQDVDPERVIREFGMVAVDHKDRVVKYLCSSKSYQGYRGYANSRMDGTRLGTKDIITPDMRFIFPERWGEHYVGMYCISPPHDVVEAALKWCHDQNES